MPQQHFFRVRVHDCVNNKRFVLLCDKIGPHEGASMARPRKGEEKDRPKHVGLRVATWVHDGVQKLAEEKGQPASEVAHQLLEVGLRRAGVHPPPADVGSPAAPRTKTPRKSRRASP